MDRRRFLQTASLTALAFSVHSRALAATYPNQDGPSTSGVTAGGIPYDKVYINPPGASHLNYRRFRMQIRSDHSGPEPVVMFLHGAGGNEDAIDEKVAGLRMVDAWLDAGYVVVFPRGQTPIGRAAWGNTASLDGLSEIWTWLAERGATQVFGYGCSMGGLVGFNTIFDNRVPLVCLAANSAVCDLAAIYIGHYSDIRKAYGFKLDSEYAAATAGHDPMLRPVADFRNLPVRFYASYGDNSVPRMVHTDQLAARLAGLPEAGVVTVTGGHTSNDSFRIQDTLDFYNRAV